MRPRFSVVIAVHDRADVIGRAAASVLAQTFADVEVVVVDAASTDDSVAAVRAVADRRVRVLRLGVPDLDLARRRGISRSRGRHVALLDPEDEVAPGWLARIGRLVDSTDAALVCCGGDQCHPDGSSTAVQPTPAQGEPGSDAPLVCFRSGAFVVRRDLLDGLDPTPAALAAVLPARLAADGLAWVSTPERLVRWNDGTDRVDATRTALVRDPVADEGDTAERADSTDDLGPELAAPDAVEAPVVRRRSDARVRAEARRRAEVELRSAQQSIDALARSPIPDAELLARAATLGGIAATRIDDHREARRLFRLARRLRPDVAKHWVRWAISLVPPVATRCWDPATTGGAATDLETDREQQPELERTPDRARRATGWTAPVPELEADAAGASVATSAVTHPVG